MKLKSLNIPDDAGQLPAWLEQQLTGLDLASIAAELHVVHADHTPTGDKLRDVLGDQRDAVLRLGLASLSRASLERLLVEPRLLLELQEAVLSSGEAYWDSLAEGSPSAVEFARGQTRLDSFLLAQRPPTVHDKSAPAVFHIAWYRRPVVVSILTAACVLLGVFLVDRFAPMAPLVPEPGDLAAAPAAVGWGWSHPDALPQDVTAEEYLRQLAQGAGAWFNKRPDDHAELAKRIGEFRQGCSVVMLAEHRPLASDDRDWLIERCRAWATNLDGHLAAAEAPATDLQAVRDTADTTINRLITALNTRANQLSAG